MERLDEMHVLTAIKAETRKLWDRTVIYLNEARKLEARRHTDKHEEIDYELRLRELEEQQQRGFRMGDYHENSKHSWKDWILGLVGIVIVAWLARISAQMDDLTKVIVRQESDEKQLDAIDRQIQRLDCTVYKVCP
jgi:hypothetical protein